MGQLTSRGYDASRRTVLREKVDAIEGCGGEGGGNGKVHGGWVGWLAHCEV